MAIPRSSLFTRQTLARSVETRWRCITRSFQNFGRLMAQLLGISVDGVWCHAAFTKDRKLHFPLLADFEPKGAVAHNYRIYRKEDGVTERALFVIDSKG